MSAWSGPAGRGAARERRAGRRAEAEARNAATVHQDTRAHREGRCGCQQAPAGAPCPWPDKVAYASPQEAAYALGKHDKHRRWKQGLNVYRCPAGHCHAGRRFSNPSAQEKAA